MGTTVAIIIGLFVVALLMFFFELLTPSFGLFTALGLGAMGGACWLSFRVSAALGIVMIIVCVITVPASFVLMARLMPRFGLTRKLFLEKTTDDTGAAAPEAAENAALIGRIGVAETQLRPSGALRIDGRRLIAMAESGVIEQGRRVKVVGISGADLVVRPVQE